MHADAFFTIGKSHKVCQDYAVAGVTPPLPSADFECLDKDPATYQRAYAIVSDGCSSSPNTDFGSRFLSMEARTQFLLQADDTGREMALRTDGLIWNADGTRRSLQLHRTCLDATLLCAFEQPNNEVEVTIMGDGVLAARDLDGRIHTWAVRFEPGESGRVAPGYPSYILDCDRLDRYTLGDYQHRVVKYTIDGEFEDRYESSIEIEGVGGVRLYDGFEWAMRLSGTDFDFIAVLTDGAEAFQRRDEHGRLELVPLHEVLEQTMAIKGSKGEFVTRRCNRFLTKFCAKHGWEPIDDFSMAAIWCGGDK